MGISKWVAIGAAVLGLGVIFGAFGAHGLKTKVSTEMLDIWEKAVSYQIYHGYILILLPVLARLQLIPEFSVGKIAAVFLFGIAVFSGSLYFLVLTGVRWLGVVTPLGGSALILGWALLCIKALKA